MRPPDGGSNPGHADPFLLYFHAHAFDPLYRCPSIDQEGRTITRDAATPVELAAACQAALDTKAKKEQELDAELKAVAAEKAKLGEAHGQLSPMLARIRTAVEQLAGLRPQELDDAARRRLAKRLYIPLPSAAGRRQLVTRLLTGNTFELSEADIAAIVERSDGYSGSDLSYLCRDAALGPLREVMAAKRGAGTHSDIAGLSKDAIPPITARHFDKSFSVVRASVQPGDLQQYEAWDRQFGSS